MCTACLGDLAERKVNFVIDRLSGRQLRDDLNPSPLNELAYLPLLRVPRIRTPVS